jgi:hypothetical protein
VKNAYIVDSKLKNVTILSADISFVGDTGVAYFDGEGKLKGSKKVQFTEGGEILFKQLKDEAFEALLKIDVNGNTFIFDFFSNIILFLFFILLCIYFYLFIQYQYQYLIQLTNQFNTNINNNNKHITKIKGTLSPIEGIYSPKPGELIVNALSGHALRGDIHANSKSIHYYHYYYYYYYYYYIIFIISFNI